MTLEPNIKSKIKSMESTDGHLLGAKGLREAVDQWLFQHNDHGKKRVTIVAG